MEKTCESGHFQVLWFTLIGCCISLSLFKESRGTKPQQAADLLRAGGGWRERTKVPLILENNYRAYLLPGVSKACGGLSGFPRRRTLAHSSAPLSPSHIIELEACGRVTSARLQKQFACIILPTRDSITSTTPCLVIFFLTLSSQKKSTG